MHYIKLKLFHILSITTCIFLTFLFLLISTPLLAQDYDQSYQRGIEALKRSDTQAAIDILYPLAKAGHAGAQFEIGLMYDGHVSGIRENRRKESKWFKKAAEQGHPYAQFLLGLNYSLGQGVRKNQVQAYKWISLAAMRGVPDAANIRDSLEYSMSTRALNRAQKLVREWTPRQ